MMKHESMTGAELGRKLLASVEQMKAGMGMVVHSPVREVRATSGLTQVQFAYLMGVSVRTLQEWERGRRQPSGAAQTLLAIATRHPEVLRELSA
jgi:putative transcriptional regulator